MDMREDNIALDTNENYERRVILQSIENTIDSLKEVMQKKKDLENDSARRELVELMREKTKLRNKIYSV